MDSSKEDLEKTDRMTSSIDNLEKTATNGASAAGEGVTTELRHNFSVWSLTSLCLCLMATWEALSSVVAAALTNGGAPCLFYN